jgi:D-amino-acid dehydrogenase
MLTPERCIEIEPALKSARHLLVGGSFTASDESGDAHKFTQNLARLAASRGVKFLYGKTISALAREGERIAAVRLEDEMLTADAYVLALGSYSPLLARTLGIHLNIYPAKGYSATVPLADPAKAYSVSLTDDEYKLVFSRLGDRLRIAGTAELNEVRCRALLRRTEAPFPGAGDAFQRALHRGDAVCEPLSEHRPRYARLDARLPQRPGAGRSRLRPRAGNRLRVPL